MVAFYGAIKKGLTAFLFFTCAYAMAQRTVTGTVTDASDGTALPGVNILEKGTSNGTATDASGHYSISVADGATLVFSFVGFTSQEMAIGAQSTIDIQLGADVLSLNEIVVTGYGSQEKKEITGSVATLSPEDFNKGNINNPTQLLQGKVAGLSIYNKGGDPNGTPVIRLRGLSTFGANVQPLVVIDGVLGASLENIDPNDIESVNVLKDGSAAAIYGSRASSGVILITTKKGSAKAGGLAVEYNAYVAASSVYKRVPVMSASEYVAAGGNDLGSETDWQGEITRTGISNVHNIAISGGNQATTFRLATNFRNVQGIQKTSGWDQLNARANVTHSGLDGKLNMDLNIAFTNRNSEFGFGEAFRYAALYNPTAPIRFDNGDYYQAILFDNYNPVAILEQNLNDGKRKNLNYSAKVDYSLLKNLTWTVNYGQQFEDHLNGSYFSSKSLYVGNGRNGLARRYTSDQYFTLFETYGTFTQSMGDLDLALSGGYSYQEDQFQDIEVELGNFPTDAYGYNALEASGDRLTGGSNANINSSKSPVNKIIAFFGRLNLAYDNAIFLNASVREEGSTKFGKDNQWGLFPAVGLGVDINKYLELSSFSILKLRAGYGVTGSPPDGAGLAQDRVDYNPLGGGSFDPVVDANSNLKWEQKAETNVGLEFGMGKLGGTVEYYTRVIKDFIQLRNVPVTEYPSGQQYQNVGEVKTPGFEVTLSYNAQIGGVKWTPMVMVSHYQTKLEKYINDREVHADFGSPGQNGTYPILVALGEPVGQIWGPVFEGIDSEGAPTFKDLNGDGQVISDPAEWNHLDADGNVDADFEVLGNGIPTFELGWNNTISIKNWDVNLFFRGAFGHSLVNQFRGFYEAIDPGAINSYNRVITDKAVAGLTFSQYSSLYVEKADFVKLDNMTVGYNFNLTSQYFKSLRLYVSGQNLFQITNYTGIDPEPALTDVEADPDDVLAPGMDRRNNYYTARTFTLGLNVGF